MPKGRQNAPSTKEVGNWYMHRGLPHVFYNTPARIPGTSTGAMLATPYVAQSYPFRPPKAYMERDQEYLNLPPHMHLPSLPPPSSPPESLKSFKSQNNFSSHNNRNALQDCGEYFGDGKDTRFLGKMIKDPHLRHHFTGPDYLSHDGETGTPENFNSMYRSSYMGDQDAARPRRRRFPKVHPDGSEGCIKLDTTTTDWYKEPDVPYKTSLQVLASSQEPHLRQNRWKYSNHGLPRIYPPYDVSYKEPAVRIF